MNIQHTSNASGTPAVQRGSHTVQGRYDRSANTSPGTSLLGFASLLSDATDDANAPGEGVGLPGEGSTDTRARDDKASAPGLPDVLAAAPLLAQPAPARPAAQAQPLQDSLSTAQPALGAASATASGRDALSGAPAGTPVQTLPSAAPTQAVPPPAKGPAAPAQSLAPTLTPTASAAPPSVRELLQRMEPAAAKPAASPSAMAAAPEDAQRATPAPWSSASATSMIASPASVAAAAPAARSTVEMGPLQAPTAVAPNPQAAAGLAGAPVQPPVPASGAAPAIAPATAATTATATATATATGTATATAATTATVAQSQTAGPPPTQAAPERVAAAAIPAESPLAQRLAAVTAAARPAEPVPPPPPETDVHAAPAAPAAVAVKPAAGPVRSDKSWAAAESRRAESDLPVSGSTLPVAERAQDGAATAAVAAHTESAERRTEITPTGLWADGAGAPSTPTGSASLATHSPAAAPLGEFAEKLSYMSANGLSSADFSLGGPGGDAVNVRIHLSGHEATIEFRSDGADTRQALEQSMGQLETLLKNEGLVLSGMSVGGGQTGQQSPLFSGTAAQSQAQPQSQSQPRPGTPRRFGQGEPASAGAIAQTQPRQAAGRLDVFA